MNQEPFDDLARGLAVGTLSRRGALRLLGSALVGGVLASIPGVALAQQGGTRACEQFCTQAFPPGPERGRCISQGAQGGGPCYSCIPGIGPGPHFTPQCAPNAEFNPEACQCEDPLCDPPCGPCETCQNGSCIAEVTCEPPQVLNPETCQCEAPGCDPPCGPCETCDNSGNCVQGACGGQCNGLCPEGETCIQLGGSSYQCCGYYAVGCGGCCGGADMVCGYNGLCCPREQPDPNGLVACPVPSVGAITCCTKRCCTANGCENSGFC